MDGRDTRDLDEAMARLASGDRSAFDPVYRRLRPILLRFSTRMLGPGPDADDVTQQALEKIFARASDYDPARPALPWAFAVTSWECATVRRRRRRRGLVERSEDAEAPSTDPSAESTLIDRDLHAALALAVEGLEPADRATVEQAFAEVRAELDGVSAVAFRKRKERAVKRLREIWRQLYGS
ncbi:MAG: sigma-70 family RNA polymerase sigma factor [Myxococcales bacterium]|nr:sigma-70 family RNA polymerase sigma factor [Myxococcales bacterium]MBL0198110.1 sigma-70 family RNA polymerase sigma factor [Myxococcales bacterium]